MEVSVLTDSPLLFFETLSQDQLSNPHLQDHLINFLFEELGQYRDPHNEIKACLDYILDPQKGGHVFMASDAKKNILGAVLLAKTHMGPFVSPYLLVYIATKSSMRGQGIGRMIKAKVKEFVKAPIALHVEHDNPAKKLYEREGFTNKYTEMRWYP